MTELYADIVLPLARDVFTFRVGDNIRPQIAEGMCVVAPLGQRKLYMGVVWRLHGEKPPYKTIREVDQIAGGAPAITPLQREFWKWLADYYMCTLGEVMRAALPAALKPEGSSREEFTRDSYRPKTEQYISLHPSITNIEGLNAKCESLRRAKKQYAAFMEIVAAIGEENISRGEVARAATSIRLPELRALQKKEAVIVTGREASPGELPPLPLRLPELTPVQLAAEKAITAHFRTLDVVLLHGVTGSGKTEIYINLIREELAVGRNVLYLVPEIAMSSQLVDRMRAWFGERVVPYHSGFAMRHRVESYRRMAAGGGGQMVLGTRSALMLPVADLGLIVVDEEHDSSYKQEDPAPHYNARDAAVILARMSGARVVLGSATPSIESCVNAWEGKYGLVTLAERYGGVPMPRMIVSDTLTAVKRGERTSHFNRALLERMSAVLQRGEQVMLFQNRRGFSPYIECMECGRVEMCPHCSVALSFHKGEGALKCHYCGYSVSVPQSCVCGGTVQTRGFGTEKVEEELVRLFPDAHIARLDRDTARNERHYRTTIAAFEKGEIDILVGTQMITKGFDFAGVALVGILNADNLLFYPDFRAEERAFQAITQVAGRAGRRGEQGEVVIQTSQPDNPAIRRIADGDYQGMVRSQLTERSEFFYPPYCRIIKVRLRHKDRELLWDAANRLAGWGRKVFGTRLLGPQPPPVERIRDEYLLVFNLKVERSRSSAEAKRRLRELLVRLKAERQFRYIDIDCDVDPQ